MAIDGRVRIFLLLKLFLYLESEMEPNWKRTSPSLEVVMVAKVAVLVEEGSCLLKLLSCFFFLGFMFSVFTLIYL